MSVLVGGYEHMSGRLGGRRCHGWGCWGWIVRESVEKERKEKRVPKLVMCRPEADLEAEIMGIERNKMKLNAVVLWWWD